MVQCVNVPAGSLSGTVMRNELENNTNQKYRQADFYQRIRAVDTRKMRMHLRPCDLLAYILLRKSPTARTNACFITGQIFGKITEHSRVRKHMTFIPHEEPSKRIKPLLTNRGTTYFMMITSEPAKRVAYACSDVGPDGARANNIVLPESSKLSAKGSEPELLLRKKNLSGENNDSLRITGCPSLPSTLQLLAIQAPASEFPLAIPSLLVWESGLYLTCRELVQGVCNHGDTSPELVFSYAIVQSQRGKFAPRWPRVWGKQASIRRKMQAYTW
ncbi:hypothetical protein BC629DRAFT_1435232 [Irpex lacteus]|nr:hypothetical protein BC629DRAFT_1435232 [Irpex lacteus]